MAKILTAVLVQNPLLDAVLVEQPKLEAILHTGVQSVSSNYEGAYFFTPSDERQIVQTKNQTLAENIVIDKIPSNYGKITSVAGYIRVS